MPKIVIIDSKDFFHLIEDMEYESNWNMDTQQILSFIFSNITDKNKAIENIEYGLLDEVATRYELGMFGSFENETETIIKGIRRIAVKLFNLLCYFNCYENNRLAYSPKTELDTLEPYTISLFPMVLISDKKGNS